MNPVPTWSVADVGPVIIGLLNDYFHDMNKSFLVVGLTFLIAGVLWLWGTRYLARDTALAATRLNPTHITPHLDQPATRALLSEPPFRGGGRSVAKAQSTMEDGAV